MLEKRKNCKKCFAFLPLSAFHVNNRAADGRASLCIKCMREKQRTDYEISRQTPRGRARIIFNAAKERAKKKNLPFSIDFERVVKVLENGKCEVTGISFSFKKETGKTRNPYAPSIDRKNNKLGYTDENSQVVINMYNVGKGEHEEKTFRKMCMSIEKKTSIAKFEGKAVLSLTELARYVGIPKRTIHDQLSKDRFPIPHLPGTHPRKWSVETVNEWLSANHVNK